MLTNIFNATSPQLYIRQDYIDRIQAEIDELIANDPDAHPINAVTLIRLEAINYTWDFISGQAIPNQPHQN